LRFSPISSRLVPLPSNRFSAIFIPTIPTIELMMRLTIEKEKENPSPTVVGAK